MKEINLAQVGPGWRAIMKGTHWQGEMPQVARQTFTCIKPVKPPDNPGFQPDRFYLEFPEELGGGIVVFAAGDVEEWLPPESEISSEK